MKLIAITGPIGAGKTTVAECLVNYYGFTSVKFAQPLKDMLRALGLTEKELEGDSKEQPCSLLGGKTPRWAMQSLGTEWGRDLIDPNLWVNAWINYAKQYNKVVVDDARFPNEYGLIREHQGQIWRVNRENRPECATSMHESERHKIVPNKIIENNSTIIQLRTEVTQCYREFLEETSAEVV